MNPLSADAWIAESNRCDYDNVATTPKQALSLAYEVRKLQQENKELEPVFSKSQIMPKYHKIRYARRAAW